MPTLSVREQALRLLVELFRTQQAGQIPPWEPATNDPYDFTWDVIVRTPLTEREFRRQYALGIIEGDEPKARGFNVMEPTLGLTFEFHALLDTPEDGPESLNCILTNIQRLIRSDPRLANQNNGSALIIDLYEIGNSVDPESYAAKMVSGSLFAEMRYKHAVNDPRLIVPGTI